MKFRSRVVQIGFKIETTGIVRPGCFQTQKLTGSFSPVPVKWNAQPANMYFWNYGKKTPINAVASQLITHPGFVIRGEALLITGMQRWHHALVKGTPDQVWAQIQHVAAGLSDEFFIAPSSKWAHQNIYIRNHADAFAVKMAL